MTVNGKMYLKIIESCKIQSRRGKMYLKIIESCNGSPERLFIALVKCI